LATFDLKDECLKDEKILDCTAGASSFTSKLSDKGYDVTAVDVLYGADPDVLKKRCEDDFDILLEVHSGLDHKVDWIFFRSSEDMIKGRVAVYKAFINDYKKGKGKRYIKAELPCLPFKDNIVSLVLCSNLLFLYDDSLSYDFQMKSVREMLRVTSREVRIYSLFRHRRMSEISPFVERIMEDLEGYANLKILKLNYRFREGGDEMMRIIKEV